ncbi:hypothetical protein Micbo1qcDRAFT_196884 [Microdochium bolleyi]|uniref:Rhodopsin domain-containing protein n=1 Tax=Microdochium bolleyi TaxID=196109 RepID=A0A136IVK1_9PEZI|nr:hypothetical protein Micbo1qcDRAFT_196884 [Microdochium bolleyi]
MRSLQSLLTALVMLWACAIDATAQQFSKLSVTDLISAIPVCSSGPTIKVIAEAKCPLTDAKLLADCICTSTDVMSRLSTIVQTSCPFQQQLDSVIVLQGLCKGYPRESRVDLVKASAIATLAVSIPIVLLRLATTYFRTYDLGIDDWTCLGALIALVALAAVEFVSAGHGLGLHFWDVGLENEEILLILFYVSQIVYVFVQVLVKLSILLLYNRLFPTAWFQTTVKITSAFVILHGLAFVFAVVFQCNPIPAAWNRHIDGRCIDISAVILVGAVFSIIEDFILMFLPITEIRKLKMKTRVKVTLGFVFAIGSFSTVTSLVRLKSLVQYRKTFDPSFDNVELVVWSLLELMTAIVTASLPTLKPLLMAIPHFTNSIRSRSSRTREGNGFSLSNFSMGSSARQKPLPPTPYSKNALNQPPRKGASNYGVERQGWSSEENIV